MAEQESGQERTEQPTPKKLREAREKGQIPRSRELNTMSIMVVAAAALLLLGPYIIGALSTMMSHGFVLSRDEVFDTAAVFSRFRTALLEALNGLLPFFVLMTAVAIVTPLALGGWAFSTDQITPKLERLDPIAGLQRIFSARGLMELVKALAKFLVVAAFATGFFWLNMDEFLNLGREPLLQGLSHAAWLFGLAFLAMSLALVLIAAIDVPFQLWDHSQKLKMTLQEVRDEMKETEGRPEVRSRIRALQQEMAQRRMMEDVPTADVIITNPTHYAVALKYDPETMQVPVIVAMGRDLIAARIREIATDNEVEIFEAPPLARMLYAHGKIGQEIPGQLYYAVAQVLAFVFQLQRARELGLDSPQRPDPYVPTDENI
jgi:flagellar biosynthetic protein FlhB